MPRHRRHNLPVRSNLDRISQGSACSVTLCRVNLRRLEANLFEHGQAASLLRRAVGSRQGGTATILVHLTAGKEREVARIPVKGLRLQSARGSRLSPCVAVCCGVVREAAAHVRVHSCSAATDVGERADAEVHPSDDAGFAWVVMLVHQIQLRCVRADQRSRASRVDGHARALQVQAVIEAVRGDGICAAGSGKAASDVLRN
mmetsp:Transcript_73549/g.132512  ORF Transcript_73549/g.132512 Transcript_73549/m.132512 type:complete len:202 (-) Transcript_73549:969-1574(-)